MLYIIEIDCICLFILGFIFNRIHSSKNTLTSSRYFTMSILFSMIAITEEIVNMCLEAKLFGPLSEWVPLNKTLIVIYYVSTVAATYYWFLHCGYTINKKQFSKRKVVILSSTFVFMTFTLSFLSCFNEWYFYFDNNNIYHRGPYFFINTIFCYLYAIGAFGICVFAARREKDYIKRKSYKLLAMYIIFPFGLSIIQLFSREIPTNHIGMTIPVWFIYTMMQELQISTDNLTNMNNRNQLKKYAEIVTANYQNDCSLYLFMIDVDKFKHINDTYGHAEGDNALVLTSDILKDVANEFGGFVARYGGDEFTFIASFDMDGTADVIKKRICEASERASKNKEYLLSLSVGYAKFLEGMKVSDWFSKADKNMYFEKERKKQA